MVVKKQYEQKSENVCFQGFYAGLKKTIESYDGKHKNIVEHCPRLFMLLCNILNDKLTDWNTKLMVDAALAYFVLPDDIIPDHVEDGYLDDLYIVSYVLNVIKENISEDIIKRNWNDKEDIIQLIDVTYQESSKIVANHAPEILRKVGLHKYQSLDLGEYSGSYPYKLAKLASEKRELLGILAFFVMEINNVNIRKWKLEQIKEFLSKMYDYDEIERIIELSRHNHIYTTIKKDKSCIKDSPSSIDAKLKVARQKVIMEDMQEDDEE